MPTGLAAFPSERSNRIRIPAPLAARRFSLRALCDSDLNWLHDLYASSRADEMSAVMWSEKMKRDFLDQQFAAQHRHYRGQFADAQFLAIEHAEKGPVGRLYLHCTATTHLLVDICLTPTMQGQGIGSHLVSQCQANAAALGCDLSLHVLCTNLAAQRLYRKLGFAEIERQGNHLLMLWKPANLSAPAISAAASRL